MMKLILGMILAIAGSNAFSASFQSVNYQCLSFNLYSANPLENPETVILNQDEGEEIMAEEKDGFELIEVALSDSENDMFAKLTSELARANQMPEKDEELLEDNIRKAFAGINVNGRYGSPNKTLGLLSCKAI